MRRALLLLPLLLPACRTLQAPAPAPELEPVLIWREIAVVETNRQDRAQVEYRVQWPVSGGAPALLAALRGQISDWLVGEENPQASDRARSPEDLLRRRAHALQKIQDQDAAAGTAALPYEEHLSVRSLYSGRGVLSLEQKQYLFTGGAHGNPSSHYAVFAQADGRRLDLADLVVTEAREPLARLIKAQLRAQRRLPPDASLEEEGFWEKNIQPGGNFYLSERGLWFCYDVYEIAPYSMGPFAVCLPYAVLQPWVRPGGPLDDAGRREVR
jgi:hypothetical protein